MVGDSLNLVEMINRNLTGDFTRKISSLLGESRERTQAGIDAGVPGILSGLDTAALTSDGANRLFSSVEDSDEGIMSKLGGMFGAGTSSDAGISRLRSIMGGGALSDLSGNLERSSGLPAKSIMSLLGFLTPVVFGVLKSVVRSRGLDAIGLSNLLASQRSSFAAATPRVSETYRAAETRTRPTETYAMADADRPRRSGLGWVLPLLLLVGLIGLIWHWASRPSVRAGNEAVTERAGRIPDNTYRVPAASLEGLKSKYQTVFDTAKAQGVDISNAYLEDGKLFIKGTSPSVEASNRVMAEIMRVNPSMDDIVADFTLSSTSENMPAPESTVPSESTRPSESTVPSESTKAVPKAEETTPAPLEKPSAEALPAAEGQTYTVKAGDTLFKISQHFYGNGREYKRIVDANSGILKSENRIEVGQELTIPSK
jgi:nucleoid-associated protein YgaU